MLDDSDELVELDAFGTRVEEGQADRIVERGTHRDLVEQSGLYSTLYEREFRTSSDLDELVPHGA